MSETLYMRISTKNIACSQRQMNTCRTSFSYTERDRERDGQKETETEREKDRDGDRGGKEREGVC